MRLFKKFNLMKHPLVKDEENNLYSTDSVPIGYYISLYFIGYFNINGVNFIKTLKYKLDNNFKKKYYL